MEYNKWILQLLGFHKHLQRIDMLYNRMNSNECLKQCDMCLDKYKLKVILIHVFSFPIFLFMVSKYLSQAGFMSFNALVLIV